MALTPQELQAQLMGEELKAPRKISFADDTNQFWGSSNTSFGSTVEMPASYDSSNTSVTPEEAQLAQNANNTDIDLAKGEIESARREVEKVAAATGERVDTSGLDRTENGIRNSGSSPADIAKVVSEARAEVSKVNFAAEMEKVKEAGKQFIQEFMGASYALMAGIPVVGAVVTNATGWMQNADRTAFDPTVQPFLFADSGTGKAPQALGIAMSYGNGLPALGQSQGIGRTA